MYRATVLLTWSYCLNLSPRLAAKNMATQVLFWKTRNVNEVVCLFSEYNDKDGCTHSTLLRSTNAPLMLIKYLSS